MVEATITQHRKEHIAAPARERDERLVVAFALLDLAFVVGTGYRIAKRREGREEQGALQDLVPAPGRMFTTNGTAGAARDRGEPCIGRQMRRGGKGSGSHLGEESRCRPDADPRHAHQDRGKRVRVDTPLHFPGELLTLAAQGGELLGKSRQDKFHGLRAGHDDRLFTQRPMDLSGKRPGKPRCEPREKDRQALLAHRRQRGRRRIFLQQREQRRVVEPRPQHPLECRMNLRQQPPDAVTHLGDFLGQVIVKAAQQCEFRERFIGLRQRAQGMRHRARGLGDDGGRTWMPTNRGLLSKYELPDPSAEVGHCVHRVTMHPSRPDVLFMQKHWDVMRTDNAGESWIEVSGNLPSDFGFPIEVHAHEPETIFVVPIKSDSEHYPVDGRLRVYRSRSGGIEWEALTKGLPQRDCYVNVLREAMSADSLGPCGIYFGTTGGQVYVSADDGDSWDPIVCHLPAVLSVEAQVLP